MLVGGIDVETTGIDLQQNEITEVGLVIWDTERDSPVWMFSALRRQCNVDKITPEITRLTGIDADLVSDWGESDEYIQEHVTKFSNAVQCYMAHNASFDRGYMQKHFKMVEKPWVCSATHVEYPEDKGQSRSLNTLAYEHNFINPWRHRAVTDVLTMCKVACRYNMHKAMAKAQEKQAILQACFNFRDPDFNEVKEKVKEKRFYWQPNSKKWIKTLPTSEVEEFAKTCDFRIDKIGELEPLEYYQDF